MRATLSERSEAAQSTNADDPLLRPAANQSTPQESATIAKPRGFATIAPEAHRKIARLGARLPMRVKLRIGSPLHQRCDLS